MLNRVLNANNGLAQNTVTALYFDKKTGLLWIGTEGGLSMYNGVSTKIYDTRNVPPFRMSRIWDFTTTIDSEVIVLDKTAMAVRISENRLITGDYMDFNTSTPIFYFPKMPRLNDTTFLKKQADLKNKLGDSSLLLSYLDDSTILAIKSDAVYIIGQNTFRIETPLVKSGETPLFLNIEEGRSFACLQQDGSGYFLDIEEKTAYVVKASDPALIKGSPIIRQDNMNKSHYLLNGKKLYTLHINKHAVDLELFAVLPEIPANITAISVHPKNNQIFIGTLYDGLYVYTPSFFYTYQFDDPAKYTGKKDLSAFPRINNLYSSILIDSNRVHFCHFDPPATSRGVIVNLNNGAFDFSSVRNAHAFRTAIDQQKNIYFLNNSLVSYSFNTSIHPKPRLFNVTTEGFYYDSIYNRLWVIDLENDILGYLVNDSLHEYLHYSKTESGALNSIKRTNGVLIVYNDRFFFRVDEVNKKLEKIYSFDEPCLRDIYIDQDNYAWITTYGKGIYMYDLNSKKVYHPRTDSKEYMLFSHCMVDDSYGNFFIPTNNGLFRVNRRALIEACRDSTKIVFYHYYDKSNGLLQNEFNGGCLPAYNKLPNGDILFPSLKGLVRIFTSAISTPDSYPLFIQKITTPLQSYDFVNNMIFGTKERTLLWEINFAQWEYPSTSGLSYQFDNDTTWVYLAAEERNIQLTDLTGGRHQLRIRNQFDLTGTKMSTLVVDFEIQKKYFEHVWFWVLVTLTLLFIIYATASIRNRQLRKKNLRLERSVNKKTLEIRSKNADLEHTLSNLNAALGHLEQNSRFQQKLIGLLGHDIMIPLQYIGKVANQLENYRHKLSQETTSGAIHEIGSTATQLLYLGESVIHWIKLQEGNFIPRYSKINLYALVDELVNLHQPLALDKKNIIKNEVPEDFHCIQEPLIIKIVLHNLLLNANKFTSNGTITITAQCVNDILNLSIKDTGVGMDSAIVEELNSMNSVSSQKGTANETGWGLGYRFIIDLLKFVHGKFSIESTKGKGTKVTIDIDLKDINEGNMMDLF